MGGGAGWDGIMGKHTIFMSCDPFFSFLHIVLLIHMHILFYYFFGMLFAVTLYITFLNVLPLIFFSPKGDNVGQCHCKAQ